MHEHWIGAAIIVHLHEGIYGKNDLGRENSWTKSHGHRGVVLFENKQEYHCGLDMDTRRRVAEKKPERNRGSDG